MTTPNSRNRRLSFRPGADGSDVASGQTRPVTALTGFDRVVLLIHGYNNDEPDAEEAYRGFDSLQRELGGIPEGQRVADGRVVEIYWPGDANWGICSFLYYMGSVGKAVETGRLLAEALLAAAQAQGFLNVDVVAHSMGCRLALEMMKHLEGVPNVRVRRAVFMAAAVAVAMLEREPDAHGLRRAYDRVLTEGAISLYSSHDMVLALAFPLGQTLTPGDEGFLPTAMGHAKWEGLEVPPGLQYRQYSNNEAGHSDYWGWRKETRDKEGKFANERIQSFLGLSTAATRTMKGRSTPARSGGVERSTPQASGWVVRLAADF